MIIWDTEFTSWKGCHENGWDEENGQYKELIQIGCCKIENNNYSLIDTKDIIVKPRINDNLSDYIIELTGISQSKVDTQGVDFIDAIRKFRKFSEGHIRYSWENDLSILRYNKNIYESNIELEENMYRDVREIFSKIGVPTENYNSGSIYKYYDIDAKINDHDAVEDSLSMVLSLQKHRNK